MNYDKYIYQTKLGKTKRFAQVKRMISPKDARL